MSYNAVLRKENAEVFGRMSLSTLETLPGSWDIMFGDNFIPKTTDLKTILCDSKFPLSIHTVPGEREIIVKPDFRGENFEYKFSVSRTTKVRQLKDWIWEKMEMQGKSGLLKGHKMALLLHPDDKDDKILGDNQPIKGHSYGLTVFGTCPRKSCRSNNIPQQQTTYKAGYGFLRIDLKNKNVRCVGCKAPNCKFPPSTLVVCEGRALFRFKKTEGHLDAQTKLLESFGGIDEYASFDVGGGNAEYDWIEVTTVKKDESVYSCSRCNMPIQKWKETVLYGCPLSHPVHRGCKEDQCGICNARDIRTESLTLWSIIQLGQI
ncbi:hypothetical protein Ocin01_13785 [Orchesella cincta]|uniref:Uncharacterized protein n=1 Tax=Orchesella cincta TaxID=48709 RepID=A0A1D2MIR5_ORCCI|nr:hypothetical protein Ocin01_13785 [Orchesella cincta]